jgi:uncharacterized membrane protein YhaH (DUF805 family)
MARIAAATIDLFDPRGRINRKGLLAVAMALLAAEAGFAALAVAGGAGLESPLVVLGKIMFLWLATAAVSKRLHDLSLSAWVMLKAALAVILWSIVETAVLMMVLDRGAMEEGQYGFWLSVGGTVLPVFALILWLHCARGTPGTNAYGPEPDGYGSSKPARSPSEPELADLVAAH